MTPWSEDVHGFYLVGLQLQYHSGERFGYRYVVIKRERTTNLYLIYFLHILILATRSMFDL